MNPTDLARPEIRALEPYASARMEARTVILRLAEALAGRALLVPAGHPA